DLSSGYSEALGALLDIDEKCGLVRFL
ncbi:MAG: hypothetical protein RL540_1393, partial [Actinomycetota bacterium]